MPPRKVKNLVMNGQGKVDAGKIVDLAGKLVLLLIGILVGMQQGVNAANNREHADMMKVIRAIAMDVEVIKSNRWTAQDQSDRAKELATRFEKVWEHIIILENRVVPKVPPPWLVDVVSALGLKVENNTALMIELKTKLEAYMATHK